MRIHTKTTFDMETGAVLEDQFYEHDGPVARADRAAQAAAKQNVSTDQANAGTSQQNAGADRAAIFGTLKNDINHPTGYTPNEINQNLTAAEGGAGGATSSFAGAAGLRANATRNSSGLSGTLDDLARSRAKAASAASGGITADSNKLAQMKRQSAIGEMGNLYGTDTSANLKSMGMSTDAINAMVNAGKSGWLQNTEGVLDTLNNSAKTGAAIAAG